MIVTPLTLAVAAALQLLVLQRLRPARLTGDEREYVGGFGRGRKHALWVRVPLHAAILTAVNRLVGGERQLGPRLFTGLTSLMSIGLVVGWTEQTIGVPEALIIALLLVVSVERLILACHLWPDITLGLAWAGQALVFHQWGGEGWPLTAVIAGVAMGLRIEALALSGLALVFATLGEDGSLGRALGTGAILVAFGLSYATMNKWFLGRWVLDTTLGFNLLVARLDRRLHPASIPEIMVQASRITLGQDASSEAGSIPKLGSGLSVGRVLSRIRLLLGQETFVTQRLLHSDGKGPGYRDVGWIINAPAVLWTLRNGTTALVLAGLFFLPQAPLALSLPLGCATLVYSALVARSRYRMALLPLLGLVLASGLEATLAAPTPIALLTGAGLCGICLVVLSRAPPLSEEAEVPLG